MSVVKEREELLTFSVLMSKKRRSHTTKCRDCEHYIRVKKGHWKEPDWKSKAAICTHPEFLSCDYRYNIIGPKNFFRLKQSEVNRIIIDIINKHQDFIAQWIKHSGASRIIIDIINTHQHFITQWKFISHSERTRAESMGA